MWTKVEDGLPEKSDYYNVSWIFEGRKVVGEGFYSLERNDWTLPIYGIDKDYNTHGDMPVVTYYQPLPSPPKEAEDE